jgi:molybdopterin converting factor small subunit
MAIKLEIPTALRPFTGKQASVEFEAATVGEALRRLTATFADLQKHLYTEDGRIRSFVNIYVNDEDIRYLEKENTPIRDGDTISIVPSIAGGQPDEEAPLEERPDHADRDWHACGS